MIAPLVLAHSHTKQQCHKHHISLVPEECAFQGLLCRSAPQSGVSIKMAEWETACNFNSV